jgi:hypothetical protein
MYYEEQIINGVLCFRTTPKGEWVEFSKEALTAKIKDIKQKFSPSKMIDFGNFIRDNYYVAGTPKMLSYHPEKYPHAKVEEIFDIWSKETEYKF